jgi:alkylation response protein AidB-like acyl-CoA dehydrogenase
MKKFTKSLIKNSFKVLQKRSIISTTSIFDKMFTEQQNELRSSVQSFVKEHVSPKAIDTDKNNAFPNDLWPVLGEFGLLGITAPTVYF